MVKDLQVLTGYLNFLTKAIFAGRTFTRRMYAKYALLGNNAQNKAGSKLKPFHYIKLDSEFKLDCAIWHTFLTHYEQLTLCRPMVDLNRFQTSVNLQFSSDASANPNLGMGAVFQHRWLFTKWEEGFIRKYDPSIEYLELYGVVAAILSWGHVQSLQNNRIVIYCDNSAVVCMLNNMASSCRNCMFLLRLLTLNNLINNRRIFARHISSEANFLSDSLSRLQFERFWRLAPPGMDRFPSTILTLVWPLLKIWQKYD